MADGIKTKWLNKGDLVAKLRRLAPGIESAMSAVDESAADEMVGLAKSFAPKSAPTLVATIRKEPSGHGSFVVKAGGPETTVPLREGSGEMWDYAAGFEFGTSVHTNKGKFAGTRNPGMKRQPFFYPAARLIRKKHKSKAGRALGKAVRQIAGTAK